MCNSNIMFGSDFSLTKRQAPTATLGADGRKACDGFYKTIPSMIANWGLERGVVCNMLGL